MRRLRESWASVGRRRTRPSSRCSRSAITCASRTAASAGGARPRGHRLPGRVLRSVRAAGSPPIWRASWTRSPPQPALETGAARVLGSVQRAGRRGQEAARRGGDRDAERAARRICSRRARTAAIRASVSVCGAGQLSLKLGRFGAFVGCSNYPDCRCQPSASRSAAGQGRARSRSACSAPIPTPARRSASARPPRPLRPTWRRRGAKRSSLPPNLSRPARSTTALKLLMLPRELGRHPGPGSRSRSASTAGTIHQARPLRAPGRRTRRA